MVHFNRFKENDKMKTPKEKEKKAEEDKWLTDDGEKIKWNKGREMSEEKKGKGWGTEALKKNKKTAEANGEEKMTKEDVRKRRKKMGKKIQLTPSSSSS